jgi:serine phosphatase RsbU (regulator of sigma subunit)/DNA-binding NarL/FixJ family response regulator
MTKIRVLIADDHPLFRKGVRNMVEAEEDMCVVGEAATGEEAVAQARTLMPDVVLMDIKMPGLDGIEATRILHREMPNLGIIFCTMFEDDEFVFAGLTAGGCGYVLKDADPETILQAVRAVAQGQSLLSPAVTQKALKFATLPGEGPVGRFPLGDGVTERDMIGTVLSHRYRIDSEVGVGAKVLVYHARDLILGRDVAIRTLIDPSLGPEEHARLLNEAQVVARLSHPNIVSVFDASMHQGVPFVVMEWIEGVTLAQDPPGTIEAALDIARQICDALEHAHAQGMTHRDLKPANVLLAPGGLVKLVEFGMFLGFSLQPGSGEESPEMTLYHAPEVVLGQEGDLRADLYSLGAMLYEWTTGQAPFTGGEPADVVALHVHMPVVPPRARNPHIPAALDQLIVRLLSKAPGDRPASAGEVLAALQALDPAAVEKARLQHELQTAREVQAGLLPLETPQITGWQFAACWRPAREVAGDYYDFIPLDQGRLGVVMADVSDKGMPAALFMALTRSVVRASAAQADGPSEGMVLANRLLCADARGGMFVTLFYGLLQPTTGTFSYANAGHNPPLWYRADQDDLLPLSPTGMALALMPDASFDQHAVRLGPGDWVLLYTDGLTDACDAAGNRFGKERMERLLLSHRHADAAELLATLEHAVERFAADMPAFDDIALLLLKHEGIGP